MRIHYFQSLRRSFLTLVIVAFILTAAFFSTVAAGKEPLSIKIGAYANHPKIFMDDNGRVSGFWPDLIEHIAKTENWKVEYVWGTWSDGLNRLKNKKIDIMPDVAFTEKRNKLYTFSEDPVLMSWTRVYVNKENAQIQSITDLKNKKIAALKGSVNLEGAGGLREIALGFNLNCTFSELDNYTEVFKAIEENRTDAGITNRNFGNKNAKDFRVKKTPILFQPINMKFAFPKNAESTPYFSKKINYHIKKLKQNENSIYYRLLEKYFEVEIAEKRVEVFPGWLGAALKSIAALFIFLILIIIISKIQVKRKTREILAGRDALQASEERFRTAFESASDCILIWDKEYNYLYANQAAINHVGTTRDKVINKNIRDGLGHIPDFMHLWMSRVDNVFANGEVMHVQDETILDEHKFFTDSVLSPLRASDGSVEAVCVVYRDITERKQAEEELRKHRDHLEELVKERTGELEKSQQALVNIVEDLNKTTEELKNTNERMQELDRLKSMFIASMSHELRTPLNSVIGFTGIILQGLTGEINAEQRDQLQRVYGSAKHLLALINDVIDISKIEAGKVDVHVEEFDLDGVIREAASTLKPEIDNKELGLEISLSQDTRLTTDRKRLLQCILNYLSNAVKFTEKGKIEIAAQEVDGMMEIAVKDTGIGIKEEDIPRLFESFVRLDSALRIKTTGTGLGLYLTRKIATEMLKGSVSVESKYGEGSTFGIRIPKGI